MAWLHKIHLFLSRYYLPTVICRTVMITTVEYSLHKAHNNHYSRELLNLWSLSLLNISFFFLFSHWALNVLFVRGNDSVMSKLTLDGPTPEASLWPEMTYWAKQLWLTFDPVRSSYP